MDRKMPMFAGGLAGALAFFLVLLARNWGTVSMLTDVTGSAKGLIAVIAVAVLVAAGTGALTLLVQPANFLGAMLFGLVPPAVIVAIGIPRVGVPAATLEKELKESLGSRKMLFALWMGLNPIESMVDLRADKARREARSSIDYRVQITKDEAKQEWQVKLRDELVAARTKATTARDDAVREAEAAAATARASAVAQAKSESRAEIQRLAQKVADANRLKSEAKTQSERFAAQITTLKRQLRGSENAAKERDALKIDVARLASEAASAEARATGAEAALGDLQRLAEWYHTSPPNSGAKLINMLASKLRSRESAERVTCCRLLPLCGEPAKRHLERALNDSDSDVAQAALDALDKLEAGG